MLRIASLLFIFSLSAPSQAWATTTSKKTSPKISVYEGMRQSKNPCYAKVETYGKKDIKNWYFSVGDHQFKLGFEPEFSELKNRSIKIEGTFKSFRLGSFYQIPNMMPSSHITPIYSVASELIIDSTQSPVAFSVAVTNRNFMHEFPNKNFVCHDLKLVKYWPCAQPAKGFENRNGWCMDENETEDIVF